MLNISGPAKKPAHYDHSTAVAVRCPLGEIDRQYLKFSTVGSSGSPARAEKVKGLIEF